MEHKRDHNIGGFSNHHVHINSNLNIIYNGHGRKTRER